MKKIESFRFWINDYITSTVRRRCSLEARGLYLDILMVLYSSPRPGYACEAINGEIRYLSEDDIMADVGQPKRTELWDELVSWGALLRDDDGWHNPKAVAVGESERDFRTERAAAGRKGGLARANNQAELQAELQAEPKQSFKPPDPDPEPVSDSDPKPESEGISPPSDVLRTSPPQGGGVPVTKKKPDRGKKVRAWAKDPRVLEIFETWKRAWGIKRAIVSDGRIRCIGTLLDRFDVSETDLHQSIIGWTDDDWEERAAKLANHDLTVLLRNAEYFEKGLDFWTKMDPKRRAAMLPLPLLIQSVTRWGEAHKWGLLPKLLTPYLTEDQYMLHFQTRRSTAQSDVQAFLVAAMSNGTDEHKRELAKAWCDDETPAPETPLEDIPEEVQDLAMLWTVKPVEVVSGDA